MNQYQPINNYINSIDTGDRRDFAAYLASRLLADSKDETEMRSVVGFLERHVAKGGQ